MILTLASTPAPEHAEVWPKKTQSQLLVYATIQQNVPSGQRFFVFLSHLASV